jgi:hypothetical protein
MLCLCTKELWQVQIGKVFEQLRSKIFRRNNMASFWESNLHIFNVVSIKPVVEQENVLMFIGTDN